MLPVFFLGKVPEVQKLTMHAGIQSTSPAGSEEAPPPPPLQVRLSGAPSAAPNGIISRDSTAVSFPGLAGCFPNPFPSAHAHGPLACTVLLVHRC